MRPRSYAQVMLDLAATHDRADRAPTPQPDWAATILELTELRDIEYAKAIEKLETLHKVAAIAQKMDLRSELVR